MLRVDVLSLFPRMLDSVLAESILGKGIAAGYLGVTVHDLRAWAKDKHRTADAQLKMAKTQAELAGIEQENARLQSDAQSGASPEQAQMEMELEGQKAEHEMTLEERKFEHEMSMKEREMQMKEQMHQQDAQLKLDMHEHTKQIASQQAETQALAAQANQINAQRAQHSQSKGVSA